MKAVWPRVVVEENNLTQAISMLRRALGDMRDGSRFIITVPGRGYRFVGDCAGRHVGAGRFSSCTLRTGGCRPGAGGTVGLTGAQSNARRRAGGGRSDGRGRTGSDRSDDRSRSGSARGGARPGTARLLAPLPAGGSRWPGRGGGSWWGPLVPPLRSDSTHAAFDCRAAVQAAGGAGPRPGDGTWHRRDTDQSPEQPARRCRYSAEFGAPLRGQRTGSARGRARPRRGRGDRGSRPVPARSRAPDGAPARRADRRCIVERQLRREARRLFCAAGFAGPPAGRRVVGRALGGGAAAADAALHRERRGLAAVPQRSIPLGPPERGGTPQGDRVLRGGRTGRPPVRAAGSRAGRRVGRVRRVRDPSSWRSVSTRAGSPPNARSRSTASWRKPRRHWGTSSCSNRATGRAASASTGTH